MGDDDAFHDDHDVCLLKDGTHHKVTLTAPSMVGPDPAWIPTVTGTAWGSRKTP